MFLPLFEQINHAYNEWQKISPKGEMEKLSIEQTFSKTIHQHKINENPRLGHTS